ncbi:hypothetical protein [Candidatus Binatus sp.]|jgi:hypothetical protein|uniref:hypothetical protein n=1 Tax=Candidatus Binatus sp. TaxID=2811406 RepID=UPI003C6520A4
MTTGYSRWNNFISVEVGKVPQPANVYYQLCDALRELDVTEEIRARNELLRNHVITWNQARDIASAIATLRMLAQKLDGSRSSS